ncbi:hypothetical protein EDD21DRAFT_390262 [Dissophora ornata]|nr:hypothetical protein BGZ58_001775 [Dissophora ornata]KAI8595761.1 hypothetical protein EDD21DRAFT_390262 [Dissophora ornata]
MALPLLTAASRIRGVLAVTAKSATGRSLLSLKPPLAHSASAYRLSSFSTAVDRTALAQDSHADPQTDQHVRAAVTSSLDPSTRDDTGNNGSHLSTSTESDSEASNTESDTTTSESLAITDKSYNVKCRRPSFTPKVDAQIISMRQQGMPWTTIGATVGVPHRSCHRRYMSVLDPNLQTIWTEENVKLMDDLVAEDKSWAEIAVVLDIPTTVCQVKWKSMVRPENKGRNRQFDILQSKVLLKLVAEHGEDDWKAVMRGFMIQLGGKDMAKVSPEQLRHRYYSLKRRPSHVWTLHEETALIQHVLKHGMNSWDLISEAFKTHTPDQCREKWTMLDMKSRPPKEKAWYMAERAIFWRHWLRHGSDWNAISGFMPKRTADSVKAFFEKATAGFDKSDPELLNKKVTEFAETQSQFASHVWSKEDSDRLWQVAEQCRSKSGNNRVDWGKATEMMDLNLLTSQYKHHHYYLKTTRAGGLAGTWSEDEIRKLEMAVRDVGRDWTRVSQEFLPHRNPKSLCHKYSSIQHKGRHISPEEYETLMSRIDAQEENFRYKQDTNKTTSKAKFAPNWNNIAKEMPGHRIWTAEQCESAYTYSFKNHLNNSSWTAEEENTLLDAAKRFGRKNWMKVAAEIPGKDKWECRLRWSELHKPILEDQESSAIMAKGAQGIAIVAP